jgi:hypothetical protein
MNFISVAQRIGLNLAAYAVVLLYFAPTLLCIRRSLIFIASQEYRDRSWRRKPFTRLAFLAGVAFSIFLAAAAIHAMSREKQVTLWPFIAAVGLSLLIFSAGVAFVRGPSRLQPAAVKPVMRISPQLGHESNGRARRIFLARFWASTSAQVVAFATMLRVSFIIVTSGESANEMRVFENLLVFATVNIIGLQAVTFVIQLSSPTLTALSRANVLLVRAGEAKESAPWPSDQGVKLRNDLYGFASSVARLARQLERRDPRHPGAVLYNGVVEFAHAELANASSLSGALTPEMRRLVVATSSLIIGGVEKTTYDNLIGMTATFDEGGRPAKQLQRLPGRFSRAAQAVARSAEPTDKLVTTLTKLLGLVLVLLLALAGQLTISEFLEKLKP